MVGSSPAPKEGWAKMPGAPEYFTDRWRRACSLGGTLERSRSHLLLTRLLEVLMSARRAAGVSRAQAFSLLPLYAKHRCSLSASELRYLGYCRLSLVAFEQSMEPSCH